MAARQLILVVLSLSAFFLTFYSVGKLMLLLSRPTKVQAQYTWIVNLLDSKSKLESSFPVIVFDLAYIILFILQHSLMKSQIVKNIILNVGLTVAERAIYNITSSLALLYLVDNWLPSPTIVLWQVNLAERNILWWTFVLVHIFAWAVIYGGSIIMDLPEILGIKQVYYDLKHYAPPITSKSYELRKLYGHVRHPSFIGFTAILWITNVMSLDRLILATLLTAYMYVAWSTDHNDVIYHKYQLQKKREELSGKNRNY